MSISTDGNVVYVRFTYLNRRGNFVATFIVTSTEVFITFDGTIGLELPSQKYTVSSNKRTAIIPGASVVSVSYPETSGSVKLGPYTYVPFSKSSFAQIRDFVNNSNNTPVPPQIAATPMITKYALNYYKLYEP